MHLHEKLELALQLERLGVDVIEAGFAISSPGDFESVKEVAKLVKNCAVASLSRAVVKDIDASFEAVRHGSSPVIHIFLATSPIHLEFKLKMTEDAVLERIRESVKYGKKLVSDIEFSAEDASRTPLPFLLKAFQTAVDAGATVLNVPDTVGYSTPAEMAERVRFLRANLRGADKVDISAHNHNDLGLATANTLAMIEAGATQAECTLRGIGERAGNTAVEEVVMALKVRNNLYKADTRINTKEIYRSCQLLSNIIGQKIPAAKAIIGGNAYAHESGIHADGVLKNPETYEIINPVDVGIPANKIVLGKHSGRAAFRDHCTALGYKLDDETLTKLFAEFKALCDKKKYVSGKDLEALLSGVHKTSKYALKNFHTETSHPGKAVTEITVMRGTEVLSAEAEGNGAVDSAFNALERAFDENIVLDDYSISSVSELQDAQAECNLRISRGGVSVKGRGLSTDVIESSILAYLDALGKL
jgi:2-isopropylmalate synthase